MIFYPIPETKKTHGYSRQLCLKRLGLSLKLHAQPVEVKVSTGNQVNENIEHQFALVNSSNKFEGLKRILDIDKDFRGVIFCRTRAATQQLADNLKKVAIRQKPCTEICRKHKEIE